MRTRNKRNRDELATTSAGQSGDIQQLPDEAYADSESVTELVEEGNAFEAEAVAGVENAKDPDVSEVTTHQVPEDDVPQEYLDNDN
jgi:N utilization substance protein A